MYRLLFTNRWAALLFVAATLLSVVTVVGGEDGDGVLGRMTEEVRAQQQFLEGPIEEAGAGQPIIYPNRSTARNENFTPDDELVNEAEGFDPTPEGQGDARPGGEMENPESYVIIQHVEPEPVES